jgi:hypothetical protein
MAGHDHHGPVHPPDGLLRETFQKPRPIEYALARANRIVLTDEMTEIIKDESRWTVEYSMLELLIMMVVWLSEFSVLMLLSLQYR